MSAKTIESLVESVSQLTVLQLVEFTKALEAKFGVSAAMPSAAAPVAAPVVEAKKEEEKSEYKVELLDGGPDKIKTIKALRSVKKDMGLTEAKKAVEEAPTVIAEALSKDESKAWKDALEAAGAKVKLS